MEDNSRGDLKEFGANTETEGRQDTDANLASQAGKGDSNTKTQEKSWSGQAVDTVHHLDDDAVVEVHV
jgi:hypothetical protein